MQGSDEFIHLSGAPVTSVARRCEGRPQLRRLMLVRPDVGTLADQTEYRNLPRSVATGT